MKTKILGVAVIIFTVLIASEYPNELWWLQVAIAGVWAGLILIYNRIQEKDDENQRRIQAELSRFRTRRNKRYTRFQNYYKNR